MSTSPASAKPSASNKSWLSRLLSFSPLAAKPKQVDDVVFPPDFLASIERLRLVALKAMGGGLREGHRLGAYKGGQLEFHGHRNYVPGDELRYVDWNTYARLGKPYVKEFAREEAGVIHLLLDATTSMSLGDPPKWTFARRVAALFAHVAYSSKDVVHVNVFRANAKLEQFPGRGVRGGIRQCIEFLRGMGVSPMSEVTAASVHGHATILSQAITDFLRTSPTRGRVIIISDFWQDEQEIVSSLSRLSSAGYDISGIHVLAPEELEPLIEGEILARSVEDEGEVTLSASGDIATRYQNELEKHRNSVEEAFKRRGGLYLFERCDTSIERVLISTLRQRRWTS
jgi:uncharacterized protein (DUF58 family)